MLRVNHRLTRSLTLHWRLTLWTTSLLLVLSIGLTILTNVLTASRVPEAISIILVPTQSPLESSGGVTTYPPMQVSPSPSSFGSASKMEQIQEVTIREVRFISLIGVGIFIVLGSMGAYWISKQALRPLQRLSSMIRQVQAETLNQRLGFEGPADEVKELANAFDKMLERLERAFEQQVEFVANAAHELRTPLATLRANLEVIRQDPDATLSDYREMSAALDRALSRLEKIVEDLLLMAKGEKEISREPISLEVLLTEVVQELVPLAQDQKVLLTLQTTGEVTVLADGPLLARAISNLIENGIRYNRSGGSVAVSARLESNRIAIQVKDTGIGIPPNELPHVFERFYRGDRSRSRHQGSSGLGLSITAHIVQLHEGHIQVESTPGIGSTFTIWLPVSREMAIES